eukprot:jgi/Chrpa1/10099/Chrysochromulina_OHIO_Genome00017420-RA
MELPISKIGFPVSVNASAGAVSASVAVTASVAAPAAGSTSSVGAVTVVSGTGSATFASSGVASAPCSTARDDNLGGPSRF